MIEVMDYVLGKIHKVLDPLYGDNSSEDQSLALIKADQEKFRLLLEYLEKQQQNVSRMNNPLLVEMVREVYVGNLQALRAERFSEPRYLETIEAYVHEPHVTTPQKPKPPILKHRKPEAESIDNPHPNVRADDFF